MPIFAAVGAIASTLLFGGTMTAEPPKKQGKKGAAK